MPVETTTESQRTLGYGSSELRRVLGLRDLVFLIVGTVIGSGIFLVPSTVVRSVNKSVSLALFVWILGGLLSLLGALTYGELSAMKPEAGGLYVYIRDCFGELAAFLFGWILFFVVSTGSVATLAVAFSNYLGGIVELRPGTPKLISLLVIAITAAVNIRGTRQSADLQSLTTVIKLVAVLAMAVGLLWFSRGANTHAMSASSMPPAGSVWAGLGTALVSVLWAYEGWQYCTYTAGETLNSLLRWGLEFWRGLTCSRILATSPHWEAMAWPTPRGLQPAL